MRDLERTVGRLLSLGTYASVAILAVGVGLMLVAGRSPLDPSYPALDPARFLPDLLRGEPSAVLWLGLLAVMATPTARVVASLVGYVEAREWRMVVVSVAVLVAIATSIVVGGAAG